MNMLHIEEFTREDWFSDFMAIEDPLEKSLLLVAILTDVQLIAEKESGLFKRYLMQCPSGEDQRSRHFINVFLKTKSLFSLRSELRGRLGLPRQRTSDFTRQSDNLSPMAARLQAKHNNRVLSELGSSSDVSIGVTP